MSENMKMFCNQRFVTSGINASIPEYMQNILWYMIEIMDVPEKDYLQVFTLKEVHVGGKLKQNIIHSQEETKYIQENIISIITPINGKIYVIDDGIQTTMMLAEEY